MVGTFNYTGSSEEFIVPCDGVYKLEVYGAQGGDSYSYLGGKVGYSYGNILLTKDKQLYVVVGGQGTKSSGTSVGGYNGGGGSLYGGGYDTSYFGAGGGSGYIGGVTDGGYK